MQEKAWGLRPKKEGLIHQLWSQAKDSKSTISSSIESQWESVKYNWILTSPSPPPSFVLDSVLVLVFYLIMGTRNGSCGHCQSNPCCSFHFFPLWAGGTFTVLPCGNVASLSWETFSHQLFPLMWVPSTGCDLHSDGQAALRIMLSFSSSLLLQHRVLHGLFCAALVSGLPSLEARVFHHYQNPSSHKPNTHLKLNSQCKHTEALFNQMYGKWAKTVKHSALEILSLS